MANGTQQLHSSWRRVATPRSFSVVAAATSASDKYGDSTVWNLHSTTAALAALVAFGGTGAVVLCEQKQEKQKKVEEEEHVTPSDVDKEDFEKYQESHDIDSMPIYTSEQVAENDGQNGTSMWMSYGGVVYDVTDFIWNHPGGSEKISTAAGTLTKESRACWLSL
jgi:predicted heme/steroid binding protein